MVEVNLLPQQDRRSNQPDAWRFATLALLPLTAASILIPELLVGNQVRALHREQESLNGEISALSQSKKDYDELLATQRTLEQVTQVAGQLRDNKTYWTNDVAAFTAQLPRGGGVAINSMSVKSLDASALSSLQQNGVYAGKNVSREIDLTGTATSQQSVVNFLSAYENSTDFAVNFRNLQEDGETGRYTFTASVGLVATPPAATPAVPAATDAAGAVPSAPQATAPGDTNVR